LYHRTTAFLGIRTGCGVSCFSLLQKANDQFSISRHTSRKIDIQRTRIRAVIHPPLVILDVLALGNVGIRGNKKKESGDPLKQNLTSRHFHQ
jgi:hypothetical protein